MSRLSTAQENAALTGTFINTATTYYLSLHTADPGTTGASEVTGGSYVRQAITFSTASGGTTVSGGASASQTFTGMPVEAGGCPYFGIWTASTSGTYNQGGTTTGLSGAISAGATITFASGQVSFAAT